MVCVRVTIVVQIEVWNSQYYMDSIVCFGVPAVPAMRGEDPYKGFDWAIHRLAASIKFGRRPDLSFLHILKTKQPSHSLLILLSHALAPLALIAAAKHQIR